MSKPTTVIETAQTLLRAIGRDPLLAYFTERLKAGKNLVSRPHIIGAYTQLAGTDAAPLLVQVMKDQTEASGSRTAAIRALGSLVRQKAPGVNRSDVITLMMNLLNDTNREVCSVAAVTLAALQAEKAAPRLRQLIDAGELDIITQEKVREFLSTVEATSIEGIVPAVDRFVWRHNELQALSDTLQKSSIVSLVGLGGIGKTTLAAEFARQSPHRVKLWLSGSHMTDLADLAMEALRQVDMWRSNISKMPPMTNEAPSPFDWRDVENQLVHALRNHTVLLVIDDCDATLHESEMAKFVRTLTARLPKLNCLLIGRRIPEMLATSIITLAGLNEAETNQFVREEFAARGLSLDPDTARRLGELAQGIPLVVKLLVAELAQGIPLAKLRAEIEDFSPGRLQDSLSYSLERSLRRIDISERRALEVLAQFDEPVYIQDTTISKLFEREQIGFLPEVIQRLHQSALVANTGEGLAVVHTFVRDYIRQQTDIRTTLRVNRTIVAYYQERGDILRAATHLARADIPAEAINLIADHLFEIINQGHAARARTLLLEDLAQVEPQPSANLRRLDSLGELSELLGEPRRAIEFHKQALVIRREIGYRGGESNALGSLGDAYVDLGEYQEAIAYYEQAIEIAREVGDKRGLGNALGNLGRVYVNLGQLHKGISYFEQYLSIVREIGNRRGEGAALGNLGIAYRNLGELRRAIEFYGQQLVITREIGDRRGEGNALSNQGLAYADLGETRHAIELYEQALAIRRELGDRRGEGATLNNLGLTYADLGDSRHAIEFYEQALVIAREIGDRHLEGNVLGNLGLVYANLGEPRRAIEFYEQQLVIAREIGDRRGEANALKDMGSAYHDLGEPLRAIEFHERALVIFREIGDRLDEGWALGGLGSAYWGLGELRRAIEYHEQHLTIAREIGDRRSEGDALWNMSLALDKLGDRAQVIAHAEAALQIFERIEHPDAVKVREQLIAWREQK